MRTIQHLLAGALAITNALAAVPAVTFAADDPPVVLPITMDADHPPVRPDTPPDITLSCVWSDGTGDIIYEIWTGPPGILDDNDPTPLYGTILSAQITDGRIKAQVESNDREVILEIDINRLSGRFKNIWRTLKHNSQDLQLDGSCQRAPRRF